MSSDEGTVSEFDYDASIAHFAVSKKAYLDAHPEAPFTYIATSALVLDTSSASTPRVLLLQRAASDSNPNKWEPPGGACDDEDASILHAAARELREEAGLDAEYISGTVGEPMYFTLRDGRKVCHFNFAVRASARMELAVAVRLSPDEHQHFFWATEQEVAAGKAGSIALDFTSDGVKRTVGLAFQHFRDECTQNPDRLGDIQRYEHLKVQTTLHDLKHDLVQLLASQHV